MIRTALLGIYKTIKSQGQGYLKGHIMKTLTYTLILSKAKIFKSHQACAWTSPVSRNSLLWKSFKVYVFVHVWMIKIGLFVAYNHWSLFIALVIIELPTHLLHFNSSVFKGKHLCIHWIISSLDLRSPMFWPVPIILKSIIVYFFNNFEYFQYYY